METLRTSEIGKRLKAEWPDHFTTMKLELVCKPGSLPRVAEFWVYHERVGWHSAPTFEECVAKVKEALAPKPPPVPSDVEVVIDTEAPSESDRSPTGRS